MFIVVLASLQKIWGQCTINYLQNPSFETPLQTGNTNGNNFPGVNPWNFWGMPGLGSNAFNIIRVNGTGYLGGPNNAQNGVQYLDINGNAGTITQSFTLGCTADLTFSGWFSSREAGGYVNWTSSIEIVNSSNVVVATSSTRNFTVADADGTTDATWYQMTGSATGLPAGIYTYRINLGNHGNFDNAFLCASPGCLLPVTLVSFSGEHTGQANQLRWKVAEQTNLAEYIIEKGKNPSDFIRIGSIAANSSFSSYRFTDPDVDNNTTYYYRLKMLDSDGRYKYSSVIRINSDVISGLSFNVYPNPVIQKTVTLSVQSPEKYNNSILRVISIDGRTIFQKEVIIERGVSSFLIDAEKWASGLYHIAIITPEKQLSLKISKP